MFHMPMSSPMMTTMFGLPAATATLHRVAPIKSDRVHFVMMFSPFARPAPARAQTLPELSATLGVHDSAAANGASTAYGARDTIMRHLPQNSAGGDPWGKGSDTRAHSTGGFQTRPSPSSGGPRSASGKG